MNLVTLILQNLFGKLVTIFGKLVHVFGKLVHILRQVSEYFRGSSSTFSLGNSFPVVPKRGRSKRGRTQKHAN